MKLAHDLIGDPSWPKGTPVKPAGHVATHNLLLEFERVGQEIPPGVYEVVIMPEGQLLIVDADAIERESGFRPRVVE